MSSLVEVRAWPNRFATVRRSIPAVSSSVATKWRKSCLFRNRDNHDLRHTGATLAAATGATTRELMVRLGHASSDAALRYQHAMANRDEAIAHSWSELAGRESTKPAAGDLT
jgi:integrase